MPDTIYLVRHGEDDRDAGVLTLNGIAQAEAIKQNLLEKGLDRTSVVLTSDAPRAVATAEIIAKNITTNIFESQLIKVGGNHPYAVKSLDKLIAAALSPFQRVSTLGEMLIVVTHDPLLSAVKGGRVAYGEVIPYAPGSWDNSQAFDPTDAQRYLPGFNQ